ncbi:MAG: hypothetical protein IH861_08615 [Chloroflexi bacterium]|nr:hypothetical protein [Chloroflexota bacterium]
MQSGNEHERSLRFDLESVGQPQPWIVHHRGLEYRGEVIVSEEVGPSWGEPLEVGVSFRIVFFMVPRRIPRGRIRDRRIGMAVPVRRPPRDGPNIRRELSAIHEARERYVTGRNVEAQGLRRTMEDREEQLLGQIARSFQSVYIQGRIYSHEEVTIRPRDVFAEDKPESWADRMAAELLLQAHPSLPLDYSEFPHVLTAESAADLYDGLFKREASAIKKAADFAPGLGLARPENPDLFDAGDCVVVSKMHGDIRSGGGVMPAQDLLRELTDVQGLTRPLALLYVLALVKQIRGEARLAQGHQVGIDGSQRFMGERLPWDLLGQVSHSESLADALVEVRLEASSTWSTALPYASLISEGIAPDDDSMDESHLGEVLLPALSGLASAVDEIENTMKALRGRDSGGAQSVDTTLKSLRSISSSANVLDFNSVVREDFGEPAALADALDWLRRANRLSVVVSDIVAAREYLQNAAPGRDNQELGLERDAVAARLDFDSLSASPSLWGSVESSFFRFRERYALAYSSHHDRYQQESLELAHRLERLRPQVEAIARFNAVPELGEPVGVEVSQLFRELSNAIKQCDVLKDDLQLERSPKCVSCSLTLDGRIPRRDAEVLFGAIDGAMRTYNRRLSSHSVRQVLAHPTKEQLDQFISLVQVADPSALANVLDDEVVEFLRRFLRSTST